LFLHFAVEWESESFLDQFCILGSAQRAESCVAFIAVLRVAVSVEDDIILLLISLTLKFIRT